METIKSFKGWCYERHDIVCNQKYNGELPYSFHLKCVDAQFQKFKHLLDGGLADTRGYNEVDAAELSCAGHDLIEDARVTYNDIRIKVGVRVAEVIYLCTEEKGRNRSQRHSQAYYEAIGRSKVAIFVKLCDVMANVTFSLLTNSSMLSKYRMEYKEWRGLIYTEELKDMFVYLDELLDL